MEKISDDFKALIKESKKSLAAASADDLSDETSAAMIALAFRLMDLSTTMVAESCKLMEKFDKALDKYLAEEES